MLYGTGMFGKVHKTRTNAHISTIFFHFCFIPIAPESSHIVIMKDKTCLQSIEIPRYWFSIVIAYMRAGAILGALFLPIGIAINKGIMSIPSQYTSFKFLLPFVPGFSIFCIVLSVLLYVHPRIRFASQKIEQMIQEHSPTNTSA